VKDAVTQELSRSIQDAELVSASNDRGIVRGAFNDETLRRERLIVHQGQRVLSVVPIKGSAAPPLNLTADDTRRILADRSINSSDIK
jgi:hypothetical protein